ncbi:MAG: SUMF1/EgtB/PvdO family nonheme iron enzyme [Planctomycetes bacterium]|nr:SUMF1/EgtB/PvdO family nonheme iron enzyme [Planctomycetota bacterium]
MLALAGAACDGQAPGSGPAIEQVPTRSGRFGSLRDLVLVERTGLPLGQALFVDRFEVTEADWREFAMSPRGLRVGAARIVLGGNGSLPVSGIDLTQARAFAAWRCCRLPNEVEWQLVTAGDGRSMFPWGYKQDPSRANTGELALGVVTPVGTFESGRRANSDSPYDLIGNVGEWTETVPWRWCGPEFEQSGAFGRSLRRARATAALAVWGGPGGILPLGAIVAAGGDDVPHVVVGSDFQTPMTELYREQLGGERRQRTGLRIYTTAAELLRRMSEEAAPEDVREQAQLRQFVWRGRHREVLQAAAAEVPVPPPGTAGAALQDLLRAAESPR